MPRIIKTKSSSGTQPKKPKQVVKKTKTAKLTKVRPKENTLAYYNCLIDQVANPVNEKVKITSLAHHCKCNKGKVVAAQQEHKQQLVQQLARNYKNFGESLGHYLQADIVGCAKGLKTKVSTK
jgi:hypothetical protein